MMNHQSKLERCESLEDIYERTGERALVVGTYRQIDVRMRKKGEPKYTGHVAVRLMDETDVMLEPSWSTAAIRSVAERSQFDGKRVEVIGTIHLRAPEPPEEIAYILGPCVSPVEVVQEVREETQ